MEEPMDPISTSTATTSFIMMYDCRACTNRKRIIFMKYLFEMDDDILELLSLWTSLEIKQFDGLPTFICDECFKMIIEFKKFRTMCLTSDSYYKHKITVKDEPNLCTNNENDNFDTKSEILPIIEICVKTHHDNEFNYSTSTTSIEKDDLNTLNDHGEQIQHHLPYRNNTDENCSSFTFNIDIDNRNTNLLYNNSGDEEYIVKDDPEDDEELLDCETETIEIENEKIQLKKNVIKKKQQKKRQKQMKYEKLLCDICDKAFYKKHRLEAHLRQHQGLKPCLCKICGKSYGKWSGLKTHINSVHGDVHLQYKFECDWPECNKSYSMKQSLVAHIRHVHTAKNEDAPPKPRFICELCGKSFSTNSQLKKHTYIHTGLMPFKCTICPKKYSTNHKLKEHTMRHQGIKNHVCSFCGLRKTTAHELKIHLNYHTREKLHTCKYCSSIFTSVGNMGRHIRIVHCGIKAYPCTHCDRSFGKSETLKHHIMTHTGEKPQVCSVCGKRFIQLVALRAHMKTHNKSNAKIIKQTQARILSMSNS